MRRLIFWELFVDFRCLCNLYQCILLYVVSLVNQSNSVVLRIKSTPISKLAQNDPLPIRLMWREPEETYEFMIFPWICNMSFARGINDLKLCFSFSFFLVKDGDFVYFSQLEKPTSCAGIVCVCVCFFNFQLLKESQLNGKETFIKIWTQSKSGSSSIYQLLPNDL